MTSLHPGRHRMAAGFGLIELMIAMVIGLLVLGAAIAVFQSNQRSYRSNEGVNRVQEGARVAYEMMSRDIRSAGTSACTNEGSVLFALCRKQVLSEAEGTKPSFPGDRIA